MCEKNLRLKNVRTVGIEPKRNGITANGQLFATMGLAMETNGEFQGYEELDLEYFNSVHFSRRFLI